MDSESCLCIWPQHAALLCLRMGLLFSSTHVPVGGHHKRTPVHKQGILTHPSLGPLRNSCVSHPSYATFSSWVDGVSTEPKSECVSCSVLSNSLVTPLDCSPPGSLVHRILQAWILEWVAIPFSRGLSLPKDWTQVSCIASRLSTFWATREGPAKQSPAHPHWPVTKSALPQSTMVWAVFSCQPCFSLSVGWTAGFLASSSLTNQIIVQLIGLTMEAKAQGCQKRLQDNLSSASPVP